MAEVRGRRPRLAVHRRRDRLDRRFGRHRQGGGRYGRYEGRPASHGHRHEDRRGRRLQARAHGDQDGDRQAEEDAEARTGDQLLRRGEYLVGEDIKAGTYKTAGPDDEWGCYWERAKDASGGFGSIIANNNLEGPGRVTLDQGEYFKTNRCQEWKRVG